MQSLRPAATLGGAAKRKRERSSRNQFYRTPTDFLRVLRGRSPRPLWFKLFARAPQLRTAPSLLKSKLNRSLRLSRWFPAASVDSLPLATGNWRLATDPMDAAFLRNFAII